MQILEISFLSNNMQHPHTLTTAAEIWKNATTKAAARKATADGVRSCAAVIQPGGKWFIYQLSGSTSSRGLFSDYLNENGQRTTRTGAIIAK